MIRTLALLAALASATPAFAQGHAVVAPAPAGSPAAQTPAMPRITPGHAAALGAGMFAGAVAGSALINGGRSPR